MSSRTGVAEGAERHPGRSGLGEPIRTVWFVCDGIYSVYGDPLSTSFVYDLLDVAPTSGSMSTMHVA
jgi:hypothetical protein